MNVKTTIRKVLISVVIFIIVIWIIGFILIKSGYQPSSSAKQEPSAQGKAVKSDEAQSESVLEALIYEPIDPALQDVPRDIVKWSIAPLIPMHFANAKRYARHVVIYQRLNKAQLEKLTDIVIEDTKKEVDFNALVIRFYDYAEFFEYAVRLGQVYYAPNGKWEEASKVKTGNYRKFKKDSQLFEPDWSNALTQKEAVIMSDYLRLLYQYNDEEANAFLAGDMNYPNPGETATREIAKKHRIDISVMETIVKRYYKGYGTNGNN
jgi:hypothetical protein